MKKKIFLRTAALLLAVVFILPSVLCACDDESGEATLLSFKSAASLDYLKTLNGKKVAIKGWLATSSPVDGSFIFLMNMPYQSCPFCKPNTNQLSNTMEAYPKKGQKFEYTAEVVQVVGKLVVANDGSEFSDSFGYSFNYKIVDAEYYLLDDSELSDELVIWQKIANSDIVTEIYSMFDYLNFLCNWGTYTYTFSSGRKDYLYPTDLKYFLYNDGSQFNYGYKDGYFDELVSKALKVDKTALSEVVTIILNAKELAKKALSEIENKNYSMVDEYSKDSSGKLLFGDGRKQYKMDDASLDKKNEELYNKFYAWFSGWEL